MVQHSNINSVMEYRDHFKNGVSWKSLMSIKGIIKVQFVFSLVFLLLPFLMVFRLICLLSLENFNSKVGHTLVRAAV